MGPLRKKDGRTTENDKEAAEELNTFFGSVYSKKDSIPRPPERVEQAETRMGKVKITEKRIKEKIMKMRGEAAPGPDGIRPAFLQQTKEEIAGS